MSDQQGLQREHEGVGQGGLSVGRDVHDWFADKQVHRHDDLHKDGREVADDVRDGDDAFAGFQTGNLFVARDAVAVQDHGYMSFERDGGAQAVNDICNCFGVVDSQADRGPGERAEARSFFRWLWPFLYSFGLFREAR